MIVISNFYFASCVCVDQVAELIVQRPRTWCLQPSDVVQQGPILLEAVSSLRPLPMRLRLIVPVLLPLLLQQAYFSHEHSRKVLRQIPTSHVSITCARVLLIKTQNLVQVQGTSTAPLTLMEM